MLSCVISFRFHLFRICLSLTYYNDSIEYTEEHVPTCYHPPTLTPRASKTKRIEWWKQLTENINPKSQNAWVDHKNCSTSTCTVFVRSCVLHGLHAGGGGGKGGSARVWQLSWALRASKYKCEQSACTEFWRCMYPPTKMPPENHPAHARDNKNMALALAQYCNLSLCAQQDL